MRSWLAPRPWIWLIALYLLVVGVNVAFVLIARQNPPVEVQAP
jgi:hypothetical protein